MHRAENRQKEFNKQSRKKNNTFNTYAKLKFLAKKIDASSLPHAKKVQKVNDTFISKNDKFNVSIPLTSTGKIVLTRKLPKARKKTARLQKNNYNLSISLPNQGSNTFSGRAKVAKDNSVVYKNYQENTDIVVQAFDNSVRVLTILNDADAPTEYTYDVNIPIGGHMQKIKDGSIKILDKNNKFRGAIAPAWAMDKTGKKVPTHYAIKGNKLIQIVEHLNLNVEYPVIADPYLGGSMVKSAYWRYYDISGNRRYNFMLTVTPTTFGYSHSRYFYAQEGWQEILDAIHYNLDLQINISANEASMRKQYYCHVNAAWIQYRDDYHLELWRPDVNWWELLRHGCNAPGHI